MKGLEGDQTMVRTAVSLAAQQLCQAKTFGLFSGVTSADAWRCSGGRRLP